MNHANNEEDRFDAEVADLFVRSARTVLAYIIKIHHIETSSAEDILQDAFLATRLKWAVVRTYDYPLGYVYKVVDNRIRRVGRREAQRAQRERRAVQRDRPTPSDEYLRVEQRMVLVHALATLPERQRQVVWLHHAESLPMRVVADILQIAEVTAKTHLARGMAALRKNFGEEMGEEETT